PDDLGRRPGNRAPGRGDAGAGARRDPADLRRLPCHRRDARGDPRAAGHRGDRAGSQRRRDLRRAVVERPDHAGGARAAARGRLRPTGGCALLHRRRSRRSQPARTAAHGPTGLPLLRIEEHDSGEPLRPHPLPLDPLLQRLPPALRGVQGGL
ncbi:MAG: hypothetical protein AVDCRST_MAG88-4293, partial [uncultured Thermomicrobiales bacterium]